MLGRNGCSVTAVRRRETGEGERGFTRSERFLLRAKQRAGRLGRGGDFVLPAPSQMQTLSLLWLGAEEGCFRQREKDPAEPRLCLPLAWHPGCHGDDPLLSTPPRVQPPCTGGGFGTPSGAVQL